ncbi:MAG TPA: sigma-70 family RNA polymerase sigma factor [Gemmataceae bacterium]|jgi:RNA polymerase sigma factor (sigma-70 family)
MTANRTGTGIAQFLRALRTHGCVDQTDGQLLSQFLSRRDEAAFVALVRRHGPMVLGVCRRVLGNAADAEDAFQATFLVLVRKAASLTERAVLGDWLHGVARRTALSARRDCARRRAKEQAMVRPDMQGEAIQDHWLPLLDEELSRLPENYRLPIVLCDLEGKTRREAADRLGWPEGTVAGRLARGRALLARRLLRHGGAVSSSSLAAVLAQNTASACVSEALLHSTASAASLLAAGTGAATAVISAKVAALTEGVVRAMFLAKLKTVTCALALTVLVGFGGVALVPGSGHLLTAGAAKAPKEGGDAKPDAEAQKLVRQLGDLSFAKRQAAEKALTNLGAPAAASVRVGMGDADPEIARRCAAIWPRLWQTEIARPDADRLAGYTHPLWARFRKVAGDDASSRNLFAELAADLRRFEKLEAINADPAKAADAYAAELKERVEALNQGWREADAAAGGRTGMIRPRSGYPTQVEFATLLFLGTFPSTAAVTYRRTGNWDSASHSMVFALGQAQTPALRRLVAAWLETRTDQGAIQIGLSQAVHYPISEVLPAARKHAASAELASGTRALALLVIARLGGAKDLPLLKRAFADTRVWYTTKLASGTANERTIEVQVGDTAVGSALWIYGQRAADFGFPMAEMFKNHPDTLAQYGMLGFLDNDTRQAAHKKAEEWLNEHKNDKPKRMEIKDCQALFDGKTTKHWKTEGQVSVEDRILKIGGDKGGSIVTTASYARGSLSLAYRHAGDAKATMTWRGEEHALSPARQGWTSEGYEPNAKGESPIRIVAPPGTTLLIREFAFRPY